MIYIQLKFSCRELGSTCCALFPMVKQTSLAFHVVVLSSKKQICFSFLLLRSASSVF